MASSPPVTSEEYPYLHIRFEVRDDGDQGLALIDTGFSSSLVIPETWRYRLGTPDGYGRWSLADGSLVHAAIYSGNVEVIGLPPIAAATIIVMGDEYILGRRILDLYEITLDHGQRVIVRP